MPVYEYVCTVCGHPVEVMHSYTAEGPKSCERCGSPMRKALSTPAIVFKGSGWAKKDHRDKVHASSKASATPAVKADGETTTPTAASGGDDKAASTSDASSSAASTAAATPAPATTPAPSGASKTSPASSD